MMLQTNIKALGLVDFYKKSFQDLPILLYINLISPIFIHNFFIVDH